MDNHSFDIKPKTLMDELHAFGAVLFNSDESLQEILFYASQAQYISYYDGLLDELAAITHKKVIYLTSDRKDMVFSSGRRNVFPYYSEKLLPLLFPAIDSAVVVTTIPDLHQYKLKRSFSGTNYIYVFHSLVSTHMMYRFGAFDHFDTVFCTGPYQVDELRRSEKMYNLPVKNLYEVGYYRLEKIYAQHRKFMELKQYDNQLKILVLVAPGWHDTNIINTCVEAMIRSILAEGFDVVLRPHPMTIAKSPEILEKFRKEYADMGGFSLDTETTSEKYLHKADVMICDWSGVALEYAFGTERPVLFVDLPRKIYNPEYERLGIDPFEVRIRNQIGRIISPDQAMNAGKIVRGFLDHKNEYREQIIAVRGKNIFNFGNSSKIGIEIILDILSGRIKGRNK
jgi:CDP-glycerol glycerophosphotransferase (TagB/SpsB family)